MRNLRAWFWRKREMHADTIESAKEELNRGRTILKEVRRSKHEWDILNRNENL
jgi:hypothetical protein